MKKVSLWSYFENECYENNDICWNKIYFKISIFTVTILKYLNLHLIKGSNKFNFNNNIKGGKFKR